MIDTGGTSVIGLALDVLQAMLSLTWTAFLAWLDEKMGVDWSGFGTTQP